MGFFDSLGDSIGQITGGDLLKAGVGAASSILGNNSAMDAAQQNLKYQKEFAQNGIRWRVADAKAAGIHPLAALGAHVTPYTPVFQGSDYSEMGQGIARAIDAKKTPEERALLALQLEKARADVEYVKSQTRATDDQVIQNALNAAREIATQQQVPAMPSIYSRSSGSSSKSSGNLDPTIPEMGMTKDPDGVIRHVVPSDAMAQRTEDKFIIEWLPWVRSFFANIGAKYFGQPIDNLYWHGSKLGYRPGKPKPKPLLPNTHGSMVYDYRGR